MFIYSNADVERFLTPERCIDAVEAALGDLGRGAAAQIPRCDVLSPTSDGMVHGFKTMTGAVPRLGVVALRINSDVVGWPLVGGVPRRVKVPRAGSGRYNGLIELFAIDTGEPLAMFPDGELQHLRVGATSAVGVRHMARPDARVAALLGTGWQAEAQLLMVDVVRDLREVRIFSPSAEHRRAFVERFQGRVRADLRDVDTPEAAVDGADIVLAATNSLSPVIEARWVRPGMHLSTVRMSEVGLDTLRRADVVAVTDRAPVAAYPAAGLADSVGEFRDGDYGGPTFDAFDWKRAQLIAEVVAGRASGRETAEQVTLFHNFKGMGVQFAAAAAAFHEAARAAGVGVEVPTDWFLQDVHP